MRTTKSAKREVTIVGGSAAGFYTGWQLARNGCPVRLLERMEAVEPTPRTLIVTHQFRRLLGPLCQQAVVNEIRRMELFGDGRTATVPLHKPDAVIERGRLIRALARQAQAAGVEVICGRRVLGLSRNEKALALTVERSRDAAAEEIHTGTVIGADGAFSCVAREAGWPPQPTAPVIQAEVRLPADLPADTVRVWFAPQDTPYFYWLIPDSPTTGVLGLIGEEGAGTRRCLEQFVERRGLQPIAYQGARIPIYAGWRPVHRRLGQGDVYLVGDAAGQVKVTTVGGIVPGLRGAAAVAHMILNRSHGLELKLLRLELDLHLLLRKLLHGFSEIDYSRLLHLTSGSVRKPLGTYGRDDAVKLLWRLALREPRLVLLGLRKLLSGRPLLPPTRP